MNNYNTMTDQKAPKVTTIRLGTYQTDTGEENSEILQSESEDVVKVELYNSVAIQGNFLQREVTDQDFSFNKHSFKGPDL